ncbi:DNA cytosine methyltransferase [Nocardia aurantiaca]|uniref:DNA (cytosine-5-)-methyltransferase n=1 Tax=Nocardia aurantiaca TaxID=2675850 RepID=A0A6I3L6Y0_9NOCA|nr:DNA cytosine methyltransferase [Nocardia aurantiaca]MTE16265.1 DNA (cytosine-5-)-methyltransferase [Nocardia aurantiaca]
MPNEPVDNRERTSVELFAGGGGLAMAVEAAGFRPLLFNEFAKRACETLALNRATPVEVVDWERAIPARGERPPLVVGDVDKVEFEYLRGSVDVLAGGPPCQPFSLGGVAQGDEDARNGFPHMFRAIREMRPKAVICENVRGLLRPSFAPYFDYIKREMSLPFVERADGARWSDHDEILRKKVDSPDIPDDERYVVEHFPVNAADYGVPQIRNRVIIVAFRRDLGVDMGRYADLVAATHSEESLYEAMSSGAYWERHGMKANHPVRRGVMERIPAARPIPMSAEGEPLKPWRTLRDALGGIDGQPPLPDIPDDRLDRTEYKPGKFTDHVGWPDARIYPGHTPNELDKPAKTVKAGVHGVPGGESVMLRDDGTHRYMTVRETARVMTFPDEWKLAGPRGEKMRQLGNAVPVLLGKVFADAVATVLAEAESTKRA